MNDFHKKYLKYKTKYLNLKAGSVFRAYKQPGPRLLIEGKDNDYIKTYSFVGVDNKLEIEPYIIRIKKDDKCLTSLEEKNNYKLKLTKC